MSALTGTGTLLRFALRRDRIALLSWALGIWIMYAVQPSSLENTYPTQSDLDAAANSIGTNPAFLAMLGPDYALDTLGGQVSWQISATGAILAGLMSMFLIGRHTRAEEESGREELVRAGVVGRYASLTAATIVVVSANIVIGVLIWLGMLGAGLSSAGSVALGLGFTVCGLVFTAIAVLVAQLTESARGMYGITGAVIGIAYVLRGIGDVGNSAFSWLSPIGWSQAMRPYADERWWPALVSIAVAVIVGAVAVRLLRRRDVGAGILPSRPGRARGGADMRSAFGLAWRLQRGPLIGWSVGLFLVGAAYGSIGQDAEEVMGSGVAVDMLAQGGGALVDAFYSTTAVMMALFGGAYVIQAALRVRAEEKVGRVESLLSTALPRSRWLWSHAVIVLGGGVLMVALGGLGTGLLYGVMAGDLSQIGRLLGASLVHVPATLVLGGFAIALVGVVPKYAMAAWAGLAYCVIVLMFGEILGLPGWLMGISPFDHSPLVPVADFDPVTFLSIAAVAAVLFAFGFIGLRRRDIQTS